MRALGLAIALSALAACSGVEDGVDGAVAGDAGDVPDASDSGSRDSGFDAGTDAGHDGGSDAGPECYGYRDEDGDAFGDPAAPVLIECGEPLPPNVSDNDLDCYDGERYANPDADGWFSRDRGDGSWDWNCDGIIELEHPDSATCDISMPDVGMQGWAQGRPIPFCGETELFKGIGCRTATRSQFCR